MTKKPIHFKDKDAIGHVVEAQARGIISAAEIHGVETPGSISAGADSARDTAIILLLFYPFLPLSFIPSFLTGWIFWKTGRAAWFGWARLERLHRILEQEKWEIEHNRSQEREELKELYRAKGFEGKLLEDVLDVLMADQDRLLRVMVEEELGLSLENVEHPLKQGIGAGIGAFIVSVTVLGASYFGSSFFLVSTLLAIACASAILTYYSQNRLIPALVWNIALGLVSLGLSYTIYAF